jgi:6-phosphogluconate dehydrogenase
VLDKAGQKGTGSWSSDHGIEIQCRLQPAFGGRHRQDAVRQQRRAGRIGCFFRSHRFGAFGEDKVILIEKIKNAYALTRIINHEVGFELMSQVSLTENWNLNMSEISRIWTNGCIIRSTLMENMVGLYKENSSLLKAKSDEDQDQGTPARPLLHRWLGYYSTILPCLSCQPRSITSMEGLLPIHRPI